AINNSIRSSIEYAMKNKDQVLAYAKNYAQEMDEDVMMNHIELYVNEYSMDVGEQGQKAAALLFEEIGKKYPEREIVQPIFI
ncbi:MAG TPA: 1,4-dihydroxy-6-naphthoate synthase, partial [Saprospiraceae bacterium]|nr:1,4-dihydroxy-6-naphthoate synthase [Saprospiraceae bacterium]